MAEDLRDALEQERQMTVLREQQLREMEAMSAVSQAMSSLLDPHELLTLVMDKSKEVMRAEASSLLLLDKEAGVLRFHVARGTAGEALRSATVQLGHGIAGWVAQTGEPQLIPDAYQDPRFDSSYDKRSGFRTRSILTVPLRKCALTISRLSWTNCIIQVRTQTARRQVDCAHFLVANLQPLC
ncbi:MAG: GAF domain-containing protein, partial [Candidatus Tectomicrobia bacterium]|nr:GAF domain-containing protein [Candidatus Tectomicrobia bacterium]